MITEDMVVAVGRLLKPHGYKGQLRADITFDDIIFENPETPFFVKIDNIPVPFFVESIGGGTNNMSFIKFRDIDTDLDAAMLAKKDLYALKSFLAEVYGVSEDELDVQENELVGYDVVDDATSQPIGKVERIDEGIEYDYLVVKKKDGEASVDIPFIDEFVSEIIEKTDENQGQIRVNLPEGLLEI